MSRFHAFPDYETLYFWIDKNGDIHFNPLGSLSENGFLALLVGQRHFSLMIASLSGVANWVYDRTVKLPFQ